MNHSRDFMVKHYGSNDYMLGCGWMSNFAFKVPHWAPMFNF